MQKQLQIDLQAREGIAILAGGRPLRTNQRLSAIDLVDGPLGDAGAGLNPSRKFREGKSIWRRSHYRTQADLLTAVVPVDL